jgi:xylose isomerase
MTETSGSSSPHSPRFGAGIWMFGQFVDRYAADGYSEPVSTIECIERAGRVGDLVSLDVNYPWPEENLSVQDVKKTLEDNGLRAHAITPHIYTRDFVKGGFTHPDATIRRKTIDRAKRAIEVAHEMGSDYMKLWPGQDGFDYPFQADYAQLNEYSVSGVREVAQSDPGIKVAIEYKFKEPRTHMFFSTAARTLLAINEMGVDNVGIVFDLGHSIFAKEAPADALQLVHRAGKLYGVEMNDNWREWDDDLTVGSVHLIETLEFIDALRRIEWTGLWALDQFPFREDPVEAARASIRTLKSMNRLLERLDLNLLKDAQDAQDALAAQRLIHELLLGASE